MSAEYISSTEESLCYQVNTISQHASFPGNLNSDMFIAKSMFLYQAFDRNLMVLRVLPCLRRRCVSCFSIVFHGIGYFSVSGTYQNTAGLNICGFKVAIS